MKNRKIWIIPVLLYLVFQISIYSCATIGTPTGGPKDTIPPQLVKIRPGQGTLNFRDNVVRLEFNEPIQAKDLQNQLIITPGNAGKYKTKLSKNTIEFLFDQPFDTNTTYTLNFREGLLDLNESNPPKNLQLAFSTGAYLDSLSLNGKVTELLTGRPVEDALVAIYRANDTLNSFNRRPYYLTKTNKEGIYQFQNLKTGKYLINSTKDLNNNLKTDPRNEPFGFLKDTINLNSNIDSLHINILSINTSELRINNARPSGPYYEINLNKSAVDYSLEPLEPIADTLYSNFTDKNQKIRVYPTFTLPDSLATRFTAQDSIGQIVSDTLYIKFEESKRAKEEFSSSLQPSSGTITNSFTADIIFNKPVLRINTDSLYFQYDTLSREYIDTTQHLKWNRRRDKLTITKELNPEAAALRQAEVLVAKDSLNDPSKNPPIKGLSLFMKPAAFISVENDSSKAAEGKYTFAKPENFGSIQGTFAYPDSNFIVQLLQAGKFSVVREIKNERNYVFTMVPPGEYRIRVLIDENGNGEWDPGNVHLRQEPEPVIIKKDLIKLNANWELRDINVTP